MQHLYSMNFIQIAIGGGQDDDGEGQQSDDEDYEQSGDEEQDDEEQDNDEQSGDDEQDDDKEQSKKLNFSEDNYESLISNLYALITYLNNARIHEV